MDKKNETQEQKTMHEPKPIVRKGVVKHPPLGQQEGKEKRCEREDDDQYMQQTRF